MDSKDLTLALQTVQNTAETRDKTKAAADAAQSAFDEAVLVAKAAHEKLTDYVSTIVPGIVARAQRVL